MKRQDKLALERYLEKLEFARSAGSPNLNETKKQKEKRIDGYKTDIRGMVEYYFPHYATSACADFQIEFAELIAKHKTFKGFCQWGRALAKSVWSNIIIPFWRWLCGEPVYLVIIGNSFDKAKQLLEDIKAEFEANPRIISDFGEQQQIGNWEDKKFVTKGGFIGQALGMGQSVRGLRVKNTRPNMIVCDDIEDKQLVKNPKRQNEIVKWIEQDLIPCMDGEYRRWWQANNRFAPVMIQTKLQDKHPKWIVHEVKAYDPVTYKPTWHQKYSDDYFRILIEDPFEGIGTLAGNAEYNHQPHVEGTHFKDEMINWVDMSIEEFEHIVGHWDIAYAGNENSDYNAVNVQGLMAKKFYIYDLFCKQTKMKAALLWMSFFDKNLPPGVRVHWQYESQFWNDEVQRTIEEVEEETGVKLRLKKVTIKGNKEDRILSLVSYYQNNRMYINKAIKGNNDTQVALSQLKGIEPGYNGHDDWPDSHEATTKELEKYTPKKKAKNLMGKMKPKNERI
jgi:phage terminase large subunit-like protein